MNSSLQKGTVSFRWKRSTVWVRMLSSACMMRPMKFCTQKLIRSFFSQFLASACRIPCKLLSISASLSSRTEILGSPLDAISKSNRLVRWSSGRWVSLNSPTKSRKFIVSSPAGLKWVNAAVREPYFLRSRPFSSVQKVASFSGSLRFAALLKHSFHSAATCRSFFCSAALPGSTVLVRSFFRSPPAPHGVDGERPPPELSPSVVGSEWLRLLRELV
mmetsp:Transcript_90834/g.280913  ORF Transcript_90834/g.280913 Transcript_90834/m.280913 type:complete len:217 (-) Transcript_90834:359-1009(-)